MITVVASKLQNLVTNGLRPMNERYSVETLKRTVTLIQERFHTSITHSERLAAAALNGIDAHGLDPDDWATVVATVDVVVRAWISGNGKNPVGIEDK